MQEEERRRRKKNRKTGQMDPQLEDKETKTIFIIKAALINAPRK